MSEALMVITFISIGFILLLIELLTPGFGVSGISGIVLLIIGCYSAVKMNLLWGIFTSLASLFIIIGFFKLLGKSFIWKNIRLDEQLSKEKGFISAEDLSQLLNKSGTTLSALRPSGIAIIEGKRVDVSAESLFIDKDKRIKVIRVEGNKVIVKEDTQQEV
jgi:membrane-bound serine protease (ClpP class)